MKRCHIVEVRRCKGVHVDGLVTYIHPTGNHTIDETALTIIDDGDVTVSWIGITHGQIFECKFVNVVLAYVIG